jgi:drug/metabolite transporter (DMT)-like permease
MALALLGVLSLLVFSRNPDEALSLGTFAGNFIIFIGMLGYTVYMIFSKKLSGFYPVIQMVFITNLTASILLFPLALYGLSLGGVAQITFSSMGITIALALGALGFMSFSQLSIRHLSAHTASLSSLLSPEFAALAGIVVYGEKISAALLLSMILSISGTYISVSAEKNSFLARIKTLLRLRL